MIQPRSSAAPIIAVILLLLPVLYVLSYLALVVPAGTSRSLGIAVVNGQTYRQISVAEHYRWQAEKAAIVFWPLEQMDRKLRPKTWNDVIYQAQEVEPPFMGVDYGP
jgi:hypothetical protein